MNNKGFDVHEAVRFVTSSLGRGSIKGIVVLGSGLGQAVEELQTVSSFEMAAIPGFGKPRVAGHGGKVSLVSGDLLVFQGRRHLYEGLPPDRLADSVRLGKTMGAEWLCSFCAVGSLREDVMPGSMVSISDHINMTGASPISFGGDDEIVFPSLLKVYRHEQRERIMKSLDLANEGVYAWMRGPQYETAAESRMLAKLGADVVGMSLVPEIVTAAFLGMKALAFGCVTNLAPGVGDADAGHSEVVANSALFHRLVGQAIEEFARLIV